MRRFRYSTWCMALLAVAAAQRGWAGETSGQAPDFQEVYQLIRSHVTGVSDAELNRAAVQGLLLSLGSRVSLSGDGAPANAAATAPPLSKASVIEDDIAYLRIGHVADGLDADVRGAYHRLESTNALKGIVLDLRYADGTGYAAAAATADLFLARSRPLLNWGEGVVSSHDKTNAIELPVAVLVNGGTAGAGEALAGVLRETGTGLILGSRTAGQASIMQSFPLKNGQTLRIATSPVALGSGSTIAPAGLKPDIDVTVNAEDEHAYYADAFYVVRRTNVVAGASGSMTNPPGGTNGSRRVRFNEAELVREHREGLDRPTGEMPRMPGAAAASKPEPERPVVSDPALARALDLLKGLAVVRRPRS